MNINRGRKDAMPKTIDGIDLITDITADLLIACRGLIGAWEDRFARGEAEWSSMTGVEFKTLCEAMLAIRRAREFMGHEPEDTRC